MPRLSIITVCLNEVAGIRSTCESICAQTFQDFEWIVIDGGSTDGTLDVLREFKSRISIMVSEPDQGVYDAMNKGLRVAKGEYLLFLNAGDFLADDQSLTHAIKYLVADVVYGDLRCVSPGGGDFVKTFPDVLPKNFLLREMMPHQASFIRRALFDEYGDYDTMLRIAADYDLFVRLLYVHKCSYIHVPQVLAVFRTDGLSSSTEQRNMRKKENHMVRKKYFPWYVYGLKRVRAEWKFRN